METYRRGDFRFNTEHFKTFAEIHNMADKPGYLGKEIDLSNSQYGTFPELKSHIIEASRIIDQYLKVFLPKYYFTFRDGDKNTEPGAVFFIEEVFEDKMFPPAKDADHFLKICGEMYKATRESGNAFMIDMKPDNLIYGHTKENPQSRTYLIDFYPSYFDANPGIFYRKASEFAKVYGPKNLLQAGKIINTIH